MASATWVGTPSIRGSSNAARMALLTVCLAGVQFTWGIEMAYCTPYLLSLGVSKSKTSLVWIAGPLSGLITQPIVGAMADRSRLKWGRRRPFMIAGTVMVFLSLLVLGWTSEIVGLFVGDDEEKQKSATIVVAVLSIYVLDFAVNAVQASCRAIIVDTLSIRRQQQGSAWASRMIATGNVISYLAGSIDLVGIFGHWFLGNTQFKKLCLISSAILGGTVGLTSWAVSERVLLSRRESEKKDGIFQIFVVIYQTLFSLPNRIRAICFIQFFAWLGWFPFLFFSSTWVGEVYQRYDQSKQPKEDDGGDRPKDAVADIARVGSMALVLFAIVSLLGSILLPWLVKSPPTDTEHRPRPPKVELVTKFLKLIKPFKPSLTMAWMASHVLFAVAMSLAVFADSLKFATVLVVLCGIPWAITCWAPFSMLGEEINRISHGSDADQLMSQSGEVYNRLQQLADEEADADHEERQRLNKGDASDSSDDEHENELDIGRNSNSNSKPHTPRRSDIEAGNLTLQIPPRSPIGGSSRASDDGTMSPTLHIVQTPELQTEEAQNSSTGELAGIYLGILNLFITLPQFVGSFMSFIIFAILEPGKSPELAEGGGKDQAPQEPQKGVNAIAVTMLIGGLGSIVAAWRTFKLPQVR